MFLGNRWRFYTYVEVSIIMNSNVRPLKKEDYEAAAIFLAEETKGVFLRNFWLDRFELWWENNPSMGGNLHLAWILCDEEGEIGGFLGCIPVKYFIQGQERIAYSLTSWYVRKSCRDESIKLLAPFFKLKGPCLLLDTTPLEKIIDMLLRLGFSKLEQKWPMEEAVYPINTYELWSFIIRKKINQKLISSILRLVGLFIVLPVKIYQRICLLRVAAMDRRYTFKEIHRFDDTHSLLWDNIKKEYDIIAMRDKVNLNWYFFGSKGLRSTRRAIEIKNGENLIGYVVVKLVVSMQDAKSYYYLEVVDMVMVEKSISAYYTALRGLLWLAGNSKKKIMLILISPFVKDIKACLGKFGFFRKTGKSRFVYKYIGDDGIAIKDYGLNNFYATPLDGDRCFFP